MLGNVRVVLANLVEFAGKPQVVGEEGENVDRKVWIELRDGVDERVGTEFRGVDGYRYSISIETRSVNRGGYRCHAF